VHESPITEFFPHQLVLNLEGDKLWIPSFGSPDRAHVLLAQPNIPPVLPHVSLRNLNTHKVEDTLYFDVPRNAGPQHLYMNEDLGLLVGGGSGRTHAFLARVWNESKTLKHLGGHQSTQGEAVSIAITKNSIVYVSYPVGNRLVAYEGRTMKLLREFQLPHPSALHAMPNGDILVGSNSRPSNILVIRDLEIVGGFDVDLNPNEKLGSHFAFLENV
jgi:hypothetical protein